MFVRDYQADGLLWIGAKGTFLNRSGDGRVELLSFGIVQKIDGIWG